MSLLFHSPVSLSSHFELKQPYLKLPNHTQAYQNQVHKKKPYSFYMLFNITFMCHCIKSSNKKVFQKGRHNISMAIITDMAQEYTQFELQYKDMSIFLESTGMLESNAREGLKTTFHHQTLILSQKIVQATHQQQ